MENDDLLERVDALEAAVMALAGHEFKANATTNESVTDDVELDADADTAAPDAS